MNVFQEARPSDFLDLFLALCLVLVQVFLPKMFSIYLDVHLFVLETGSYSVALAELELNTDTNLALTSQRSACICLLGVGIKVIQVS